MVDVRHIWALASVWSAAGTVPLPQRGRLSWPAFQALDGQAFEEPFFSHHRCRWRRSLDGSLAAVRLWCWRRLARNAYAILNGLVVC